MREPRPFRAIVRGSRALCAGVCMLAPAIASAQDAPCEPAIIAVDLTIGSTDFQYDDTELVVIGATVTIAGVHRFCRLTLEQGAVLTSAAGDSAGVVVDVSGGMTIDAS